MNNWVGRALNIAISALLITAMGGAMGGILRENEAIQTIGNAIAATNFPAILVPFLLAAILMTVCGSMTTASMTAAGLMAALVPVLGMSPVVAALAIGAAVSYTHLYRAILSFQLVRTHRFFSNAS